MNRLFLTSIVAALSTISSLQAEEPTKPNALKRPTAARIRQLQMERFGGMIKDTRQQKGRLVVVNAQTAAKDGWLKEACANIENFSKIAIELSQGSFSLPSPKVVGDATLFIVDDAGMPMSLVAPEGKWAMMNVATLKSDKEVFFEKRVKKAISRALAYLMGAASSQADISVMGCITKSEDYDQIMSEKLPIDVVTRFPRYLVGYGITPYTHARYQDAVSQGWAPAPTNDFQKAIWEKVRNPPEKPLKITYDKDAKSAVVK